MTRNNAAPNPAERFAATGSQLMKIFMDRAAEQDLEDTELHAFLTAAIDGTVTAQHIAAATGVATSEATTALETLRQRGLLGPGAVQHHDMDSPWYLNAAGEASAKQLMKPSEQALDATRNRLGNARIERITQALARATSTPPTQNSPSSQ